MQKSIGIGQQKDELLQKLQKNKYSFHTRIVKQPDLEAEVKY
jgi:hypothetical protein